MWKRYKSVTTVTCVIRGVCQAARNLLNLAGTIINQDRFVLLFCYDAAMTSISTSASFGSRATCTVERAGGAWLKNLP